MYICIYFPVFIILNRIRLEFNRPKWNKISTFKTVCSPHLFLCTGNSYYVA